MRRHLAVAVLSVALSGCSAGGVVLQAGVAKAERVSNATLETAENVICGLRLPAAAYIRRYGGDRWQSLSAFCQWNIRTVPDTVPNLGTPAPPPG